jgi:hypothetical protein
MAGTLKTVGRRATGVAIATLLISGSLIIPPSSSADPVPTTDPLDLSTAGQNAFNPQMAVDAGGNAVMVWVQSDGANDRVTTRRRSAWGALSGIQTLSAAGRNAYAPALAVDPTGNSVIAWLRFDGTNTRVQAVRRSASGALSAVKTLSAAGQDTVEPVSVGVDDNGNAVIAWSRYDGSVNRIQAVRWGADGSIGSVQTLSASGADALEPAVAVDPDGNAVVVWSRSDGANSRIQAIRRAAGGNLSSVKNLSTSGRDAHAPRVGIDAQGSAIVAWLRSDGSNDRVQVRRRSRGGTLTAVQNLSAAGQSALTPSLAVDGTGRAVVAWGRSDGANDRIQIRRRAAGGGLSAVKTVSDPGQDAVDPKVGLDAEGNATAVWHRSDGANARVQVVRRSSGGSLSAVETLSAAGQSAATPAVAVQAKGNAIVAWSRSDGSNVRIQGTFVLNVQALSAAGFIQGPAEVALDPKGNAVASWFLTPYLDARRRSASGDLSPLQHLTPGSVPAQNQQVALDANGNALVVWREPDSNGDYRIRLRRRSASGSLSAVQTLSAAGQDAGEPQIGLDTDGNAIVAWTRWDGTQYRVQVRRRSASGSLSTVQTLSAAGAAATELRLAVERDGDAIVVWRRSDGSNNRIELRRRSSSGALSPVTTLSPGGANAINPNVALDRDGRAVVSWTRFDGANWRVQAVRRSAGGTLSSVKSLSAAGQDALGPQLAVDASGDAVVVWTRSDGANVRVEARRRAADGSLSAVQTLSAAGAQAGAPAVAVDASGNAVVVWTRWDGANWRAQAIRRSQAGSLSPVQTFSPAGENAGEGTFNGPRVVVDATGAVTIVVWYRSDGVSNSRVFAARL